MPCVARPSRVTATCPTFLANVSGDEFRHLEHADLALAVEDGSERIVGVDLSSLRLILKTVPLDVVPKLFGEFRARKWLRTDNCGQFFVGLEGPCSCILNGV